MEPTKVNANPVLRFGLSYLSSCVLGLCIGICMITLLINLGAIVDQSPSLDNMAYRILHSLSLIKEGETSFHIGTKAIISLGWTLLSLLGIILEGLKYAIRRIVPSDLHPSFRKKLAYSSILLAMWLGANVIMIDCHYSARGQDKKPLLMFSLLYAFAWGSMTLGLAIQECSDRIPRKR